jgi:predicted transposase YdaD
MAHRDAAGALFRERLPRALASQLADAPPEAVPCFHVGPDLRAVSLDGLFRLRLRSGAALFVYCLVEHKSAPDRRVALQLLRYLTNAWEQLERDREAGDRLPAIVPMVLYHGAQPWTVPPHFLDLVELPPAFALRPLDFEMVVVDLATIEDRLLSQNPTLRAGLLELKYATRPAAQQARLREVLQALKRAPWILRPGWVYIIRTYRPIDRAHLLEEVRRVMPEHEEELMSIAAEEWRAEWRAEGLADGLLRVLSRRFGPIPEELRSRLAAASPSDIDTWFDRAIDAPTLEAVFDTAH